MKKCSGRINSSVQLGKSSTNTEKRLVVILLDAFRGDYLSRNTTPYLQELTQRSIYTKFLRPNYGFCEISEFLTGTHSNLNKNFAILNYTPEKRYFPAFLQFLDYIPVARNRVRNYILQKVLPRLKIEHPVYRVPHNLLPLFSPTEGMMDYENADAFRVDSIFQQAKRSAKSVYTETFVKFSKIQGSDDQRVEQFIHAYTPGVHLHMLYLGEADLIGHLYGPGSEECEKLQRQMDKRVQKIVHAISANDPEVDFLIFGDHGMLPVENYVDVLTDLKRLAAKCGAKIKRDFLYFLDSTLLRLWIFRDDLRSVFLDWLSSSPYREIGEVITKEMAIQEEIPIPGEDEYGDIMWRTKPGWMIFPDFFNRQPCKGMHGYDTRIQGQKGFAIYYGREITPTVIEEARLVDICPTICDGIGIPYPAHNIGKSLLNR